MADASSDRRRLQENYNPVVRLDTPFDTLRFGAEFVLPANVAQASMPRTSIQPSNSIHPGSVQRMRTHPPSWKCRARDFGQVTIFIRHRRCGGSRLLVASKCFGKQI